MRVLAVPVAFNEEKKIGRVLDRFTSGLVDAVVVVDDGSTDSTARVAEERGVRVISHEQRKGVGCAIRTGIRHAQSNGYGVIVIMAGNDKDRPSDIARLTRAIERDGYDFVQGSRYLEGGKHGQMPLYRRLATGMLHPWLFSLLVRRRITDSTNGFRAIRLAMLEDPRIDLDQDWLEHYELEPYLFFKAIRLGYRVTEVPVTKIYPPKELGYTKMKPITGWWSILRPIFLLGLGLRK